MSNYDHKKHRSYVLPMAKTKSGKLVILLGKESSDGSWSGFGGGKEKNERPVETAVRECYEESMGFLGDHKHISSLISHIGSTGNHHFYHLPVEYNQKLKSLYVDNYKLNSMYLKEHLREKTDVDWVDAAQFRESVMGHRTTVDNATGDRRLKLGKHFKQDIRNILLAK